MVMKNRTRRQIQTTSEEGGRTKLGVTVKGRDGKSGERREKRVMRLYWDALTEDLERGWQGELKLSGVGVRAEGSLLQKDHLFSSGLM